MLELFCWYSLLIINSYTQPYSFPRAYIYFSRFIYIYCTNMNISLKDVSIKNCHFVSILYCSNVKPSIPRALMLALGTKHVKMFRVNHFWYGVHPRLTLILQSFELLFVLLQPRQVLDETLFVILISKLVFGRGNVRFLITSTTTVYY